MAATASPLLTLMILLPAAALGAQPTAVTRPAPPLRPSPVGPAHEITIYRDRNYNGPAVSIPHDEPNLRLVWTVNSARVRSGTWQLCERPNYQGICFALSADSGNLGHRRVQSAREGPRSGIGWRAIGRSDVHVIGWVHRRIDLLSNPSMNQLRLCAEGAGIRLRDARVRFAHNLIQTLNLPSQLDNGRCTDAQFMTAGRRNPTSVEVTAASIGIARGRIRVEGR